MPVTLRQVLFAAVVLAAVVPPALAQRRAGLTPEQIQQRWDLEHELESISVIQRKVMVPMRDGKRMATDVYHPKDGSKKYPTIFSRTPYNFNYWDVRNGAPRDMSAELDAVKRGYAYVEMNERGHFFSEGNYDILGAAAHRRRTTPSQWISTQPWSNGKVGLIGCSSTAEWQMGVAAHGPPGLTTMIPQGFGAGVGRVGRYYEQGNWYRGGAVQMLFIAWLYGEQNQVRPMFPPDTSQEDLIRASKIVRPGASSCRRWTGRKALRHLPEMDIIKAVDGPHGIFADSMPVATGGAMIKRTPNDPAWYRGGLWHDDMPINVPGLWFMSWYDVSIGPNLAAYNHVRRTATAEGRRPAVRHDRAHAALRVQARHREHHGRRAERGRRALRLRRPDLRLVRPLPQGRETTPARHAAQGPLLHHGHEQWQSSDTWPPAGAEPMTFYLVERRQGQHAERRRHAHARARPRRTSPTRSPTTRCNPVPSHGGNVCCTGNAVQGGAFDQREMEAAAGHPGLHQRAAPRRASRSAVRSRSRSTCRRDAKDTDFTVKLIDVYPDGTAYNLDETIQRVRYREGYDKPPRGHGAGQGVQGHVPADDHQQLLRRRATGSGSRCRAATSRASTAT